MRRHVHLEVVLANRIRSEYIANQIKPPVGAFPRRAAPGICPGKDLPRNHSARLASATGTRRQSERRQRLPFDPPASEVPVFHWTIPSLWLLLTVGVSDAIGNLFPVQFSS